MTTDAPTLYPELHEVSAPSGQGLHGYYRKANGWVVTGPTTKGNRDDFEYMGHTFLLQYGQFKNVDDRTHERDINGVPWNSYQEAWRRILQLGGAKEFPLSQIIAYHWHIKPPYREVSFPQLEGVKIYDLFCPECDNGIFSSINEAEVAQMLRQHLMSKINEAHSYRVEDLQKLGQEWGIDFFNQRVGRRSVRRAEVEAEPVDSLVVPEAPQFSESGFKCPDCGQEFDTGRQLQGHKLGAHKVAAP